jgi:16S rRNA (cytosine1402-N4)-methyltransferase
MSKPKKDNEHAPVMMNEVLKAAAETSIPVKLILDGTFGRGGHTRALLEQFPEAKVIALDRDPQAIEFGQQAFQTEIAQGRLTLLHRNFHEKLDHSGFDVILLDLGVSSPQLDEGARGFSFYHDGPLDMRMDTTQGITAADIVNTWPEVELQQIFREFGEISRPNRVVERILEHRRNQPFKTALELSQLIERADGWRRRGHHPATQYFLALRIVVNNELEGLQQCLPDFMRALTVGGRMIVITFHSLEDRILKYAFKEADCGWPVNKKVIVPERKEILANPRSRSAKLRVFQRGDSHDEVPRT